MTNKLIEFLLDPESKGLILGNNGFRAERYTFYTIGIWYEGEVICKIEHGILQHGLHILRPKRKEVCDRLTEVLHLLGLTALSVKWFNTRAQIQRKHKGHTEAGMSMTGPIELKVTV